ncbi:MAG: hypothetical protein RBJ76_05445 [Stenomitos frigidus ULC029]
MNKLKAIDLNWIGISLSKWLRQHRTDVLILVSLGIAIAIATYFSTYQIPNPVITDFYAQDVWFGSDIPTVFGNITSVNSDFGRNNKHPLFPLIVFPLVFGLSKLFQTDALSAVRLLIVIVAVLWLSALYVLFRCMGCQRLDATLLSLVGAVSAASMFWLVVPESFSFGSLTILLGFIFATLAQYRPFSTFWYVVLNVITVSITITNAMVGIFTTFVNQRWKKVIQIGITALLASTGLWILQRLVFTNSGFPFQPGTFIGEKKFISTPGEDGLLSVLSSFFYQTMVMPAIRLADFSLRPDWVKLATNNLAPASGGLWGAIAIFAWSALLLLGVWGFFSSKRHPKLRLVLGLTLAAQLGMHSLYGVEETFIYSLHFIPLLLMLAAFGFFTRFRLLALVLAALLVVSAGINNRTQFNQVTAALWNYGTPQQQVEAQMKLRPADPWLRSVGHVILSRPGSAVVSKAFHEPGGSFSPSPGSFGVSLWVTDREGKVKTTSDSLPLEAIQQQLIGMADQNPSAISTKTADYELSWSSPQIGKWNLSLKPIARAETQLVVLVRSVGPAGGALDTLAWSGQQLLLNDRWVVKGIPTSARVYLGSENTQGWQQEKVVRSRWQDPHGWGYARIELTSAESSNLVIEDQQASPTLPTLKPTSNLVLALPDAQFAASLTAQVNHLLMGLVGTRAYSSDPISKPLPLFRDGAYQMVALAHAGQLDVAKQLSPYFAETDFLNGSLPEADIPALGLWALTQVADSLRQPEYDRWLWSHVHRKAALIEGMVSSHRPGYPVLSASKFPYSEYPDFLRVDLVRGTMGHTPGLISLDPNANAMSYRALQEAARLADRVNQPLAAKQWRSLATQLQTAWQEGFDHQFAKVDATYTNGLWPSSIALTNQSAFLQELERRWQSAHDGRGALRQPPESTHFNLAEAHQWLLLKQPDRVWSTLQWFWQHQASPGLYTWWDRHHAPSGTSTPGSLSHWYRFRGWVKPPHTTPSYWTAAEMLLLQLDMLAHSSYETSEPTLVVGAGIPQEWLNQNISVKGLFVDGNLINWLWDGQQLTVQIQGKKMNVQPGKVFPKNTRINLVML